MAVGLQTCKACDWSLYNVCTLRNFAPRSKYNLPFPTYILSFHVTVKKNRFILKHKICTLWLLLVYYEQKKILNI